MNDSNRMSRWVFVLGLVGLSLLILWPPSETLKGGIDLVGGTSLLFEIDTTGLEPGQERDLAGKVMRVLKERVDPKGQMNLEWRPVGNTRLEIRMPRPPKEAVVRREAYEKALALLEVKNLRRFDVETALNAAPRQRGEMLENLKHGVVERDELIVTAESTFDALATARSTEDEAALSTASSAYEKAVAAILATNLPINRLSDVLDVDPVRRGDELAKLIAEYPSFNTGTESEHDGKLITKVAAAYDVWAKHKGDLEDPSDLKRRLRGAGVLEFRILADRDSSSPTNIAEANPQLREPIGKYVDQLQKYGPRKKSRDRFAWFPVDDVMDFMHLKSIDEFEAQQTSPGQPIVEAYAGKYYTLMHDDPDYRMLAGTGRKKWSLRAARGDRDVLTGENIVLFYLDPTGGQLFGKLTGTHVNRNMSIMLDGSVMSWANINERITDSCRISGKFSQQRMLDLVTTLEAGSLPARLKETPLSEVTVGPSLGEKNRTAGMRAAVFGGVCVAVFMLFYYGIIGGGIANIALALNLLFVLAAMALMQATFTLPGIAGLVLTLGMAVDANVLIFERIREEVGRGAIFKKAMNAGYDKAFSAIFDANLTTIITCVILGFVGSEEVKGFAITLGLGVSISMFTALFVTRLILSTLVAKRKISGLSMRRIIGVPTIDWMGMRRIFLPASTVVVVGGLALFLGLAITSTEKMFDIEFLGGTSMQIDLKEGETIDDEGMRDAIISESDGQRSAVGWLIEASEALGSATIAKGEDVGTFTVTSDTLTGGQIAALMHTIMEDLAERGGISTSGRTASFVGKLGKLTQSSMETAVATSALEAAESAHRLRSARVQSVSDESQGEGVGLSFELSTIETNREVVQAAVLATLGDRLAVQQSIKFTTRVDDDLTREPFFVVEQEDEYLSDVLGGDANFDVRRFRGGVAIEVRFDDTQRAATVSEVQRRLREIGLQPEFEQYRTWDSAVFPLGEIMGSDGDEARYKRFAVCAADDTLPYEDDPTAWTENLARAKLAQVEAALGSEKSFSKVIQFAPQIAGQATNRALFALILAIGAIATYVAMRFGTKEWGMAAIVALVHDVSVTLGLLGICQLVGQTALGKLLMLDAFKIDLPMIAALLTVIGYSLNDTIVVFDRIRENRGRSGTLNASLVNTSINQTISRTLLTSLTTLMVVTLLFVLGGRGVHGFAFALIVGVVVGTYSSVGIASTLLCQPKLLRRVMVLIVTGVLTGVVFAATTDPTTRLVLVGVVLLGGLWSAFGRSGAKSYRGAGRPVGA